MLDYALSRPEITSVVALTRRPLSQHNPKLTTIIHKDFNSYPESVLDQLSGAQACIWALGAPTSGKAVHAGYTNAAVEAFKSALIPKLDGNPLRFIYTSGVLIPLLDSPFLFFLGPGRTYRGDMDRSLLALNHGEMKGKWETVVVRPASVIEGGKPGLITGMSSMWILREELGAAMVELAVNGSAKEVLTNMELKAMGESLLKDSKVSPL